MAMDPRTKIGLTNIFGKASTLVSCASTATIGGSLGYLLVSLANSTGPIVNPATPLTIGLVALGVSLASGGLGMYLGKTKKRLVNEFNSAVAAKYPDLEYKPADENKGKAVTYSDYHRNTVYYAGNDGFWPGYFIGGGGHHHHSSSSSSSSSSYSGGGGNNNNAGAAIAIIALVAAVAASCYMSYKSAKLNFSRTPDLLVPPKTDFMKYT